MVATMESERTTTKQNNKVSMAITAFAFIGALVALIWLAIVTSSLNEARAKLDSTQNATRTLQTQLAELSQRTQSHGAMLNMPQMKLMAPRDAMNPMQGMPGTGMEHPPGGETMPQQPQAGGHGMGNNNPKSR